MVCSCEAHNSIFVHACFFFHASFVKFLCFLFFNFSTYYNIFSIDYLSCSNSLDEVFFRFGNIKTQTIFLSLTQCSTLVRPLPPFLFKHNLSTSLFMCNAPYIVIISLDFLSTYFNSPYFHCSIPGPYLNTPLPMHLLLLICFSHLVLILGAIKAFAYIPLLFFLSFYSL